MRVLRIAASVVNLVMLALSAAALATKLSVPGEDLLWDDLSLATLLAAALGTLVCLRPWTQFRSLAPGPFAPWSGWL